LEVEGILSQERAIDVSQTVPPTRVRLQQPVTSQHAQPDRLRIVSSADSLPHAL